MQPLKIVHCGIFNEKDNGNFFYGLERKLSHGLAQNGHFVYDFSYRDVERNLRFLGFKKQSTKKMNAKLIEICKNINADMLLLAKAEKIDISTLQAIKKELPALKIAQWYVDHLEEPKSFFENIALVDVFFYANALPLQELSKTYPNTTFSFFPNISDAAFDKHLEVPKTTDVIYIARDYKEDVRFKFATLLDDFCKREGINHQIYASLGKPPIFGHAFHQALNSAKIAINFNRDDALNYKDSKKLLGASDRMAQFLGCGVCTFSPRIDGFEKLYLEDEEIVYFESPEECFSKIKALLENNGYEKIAQKGMEKTLKIANAKRVSQFMLEVTYGANLSEAYEWNEFIYKKGEKQ